MSNYLNSGAALGALVTLGEIEGQFVLPDTVPERLLFLTAGSGVTPVMAMVRSIERSASTPDIVHVHSARTSEDAIFGSALTDLAQCDPNYRFVLRTTGIDGRVKPADLDELCPDWRERATFACGPGPMLDTLREFYDREGVGDGLHVESFEHFLRATTGAGGTITFTESGTSANCDGATTILAAGEGAGAHLPFGCRMGICHTCTGRLSVGSVRDLRTGEVTHAGTEVRTCVSCPDGDIAIDL